MTTQLDEFSFLAGDAARVGATHIPEITRLSVETSSGMISALKFGSEASTFTFLHGAGLNAHTFDPTVLALNEPALVMDLPGHGRSSWRGDGDYRASTLAPPVAEVLQSQTRNRQVLVGHSLGGLTAIRVAAEHPTRIQHLVLIDITPGVLTGEGADSVREFIGGESTYDSVDEIVDRAIEFDIGHDRAALRRGITLNTRLRPDGKLEWTHHLAHLLAQSLREPSNSPFDSTQTSIAESLWNDLGEIRLANVPITLIRGDSGMVSAEHLREWQTRIPSSTVHTVHAGHNVQEHEPLGLAQLLGTTLAY